MKLSQNLPYRATQHYRTNGSCLNAFPIFHTNCLIEMCQWELEKVHHLAANLKSTTSSCLNLHARFETFFLIYHSQTHYYKKLHSIVDHNNKRSQ